MAGKHGFGAKFFIGNPTTLAEIADIISVGPPSQTVETIDVTSHGSAGGVREFVPGLIDAGELSIKINYIPGSPGDVILAAALSARTARPWKINLPAATGTRDFTGNGVVTSYEKDEVGIDDKMTATLTMKVSGLVTEAAGA